MLFSTSRMRIFYTITKSEMGGAQTYLWRLLECAKVNGDEVVVMADKEGWLSEKAKEFGATFIANSYYKNSYNPINLVQAIIETRQAIKAFAPDIVHANSGGAGFFTRLACIGLAVRVVFTAHGWSFTEGTPFFRKLIAQIGEAILVPFTSAIVCVSVNDARLAYKYLDGVKNKITVIHNGVPIPQQAHVGGKGVIVLLFVGRLTRPKLPMSILQALAALSDEYKQRFTLTIVGDGPQKKALLEYVQVAGLEEQVVFTVAKTEEMNSLYVASDVFVLPTEWEGFPMTIVEAMAAGLPVIASAVGGIPEAVDATVGALLPRGKEVDGLVDLFIKIADDPSWLPARGNAARSRAEAQFSAEEMCNNVWNIYEQS